jgi:hypothetical protein
MSAFAAKNVLSWEMSRAALRFAPNPLSAWFWVTFRSNAKLCRYSAESGLCLLKHKFARSPVHRRHFREQRVDEVSLPVNERLDDHEAGLGL